MDLVVSDYDLRNAHKKLKKKNLTSASVSRWPHGPCLKLFNLHVDWMVLLQKERLALFIDRLVKLSIRTIIADRITKSDVFQLVLS